MSEPSDDASERWLEAERRRREALAKDWPRWMEEQMLADPPETEHYHE